MLQLLWHERQLCTDLKSGNVGAAVGFDYKHRVLYPLMIGMKHLEHGVLLSFRFVFAHPPPQLK
jgi:hypothetical protein